MASTGADMQATNNELVTIIEELKDKRQLLDRSIQVDEEERHHLNHELKLLQAKLQRIDDSLAKKYAARGDFDKTIQETAVAFGNILDSSRVLLTAVKRESLGLASKAPM